MASETLPIKKRSNALRPCEPSTIKSACHFFEASMIADLGSPCSTAVVTFMPRARSVSAVFSTKVCACLVSASQICSRAGSYQERWLFHDVDHVHFGILRVRLRDHGLYRSLGVFRAIDCEQNLHSCHLREFRMGKCNERDGAVLGARSDRTARTIRRHILDRTIRGGCTFFTSQ